MWDAVLFSLIVTLGTIVTATIGAVGIVIANRTLAPARSTHHLIKSRVDELLESARLLAAPRASRPPAAYFAGWTAHRRSIGLER